jgi:hypothetical protein
MGLGLEGIRDRVRVRGIRDIGLEGIKVIIARSAILCCSKYLIIMMYIHITLIYLYIHQTYALIYMHVHIYTYSYIHTSNCTHTNTYTRTYIHL